MPHLTRVGSTLKDLNRLREILQILVRHGFGFLIDQLNLSGYLPGRIRFSRRPPAKRSVPERLRLMLEELGPVFIKFGQMLSMRPDWLPPDYIFELSKLQDRVPPFGRDEVNQAVRDELGAPPEKLFRSFDPTPIAAASMAQVHRAETRNGRQVALKIQRPGLKAIVDSDIEILRFLARLWENVNRQQDLPRRPLEVVDEFERLIREELDFLAEGRHVEQFRKNFQERPAYRFPRIYWALSTSRCLTQEYIPGRKLTSLRGISETQKKQLAQRLVDAYLLMALQDRFFHADPHGGNLLLDPQGRLAFLDAGQVGRLDSETMAAFTDMLLALVRKDTDALVEAYLSLGTADENVDLRMLKRDAALFLEKYYALPMERISLGQSLQELITLSLRYRIQLPPDFVVLGKTFMGAEGLARSLNPRLNLVETVRPMAERILRRRYAPGILLQEFRRQAGGIRRFLAGLPGQMRDLLGKLQHGHLKIEFEHRGLEDFQHSLERDSNRLSFSMVVAALIVGSSLLLFSRIGPSWGGLSLLGLVGFLMAGLFGIWLIVSILRSGRL